MLDPQQKPTGTTENKMSSARLLTIPIVGVLLGAPILFAGDFSSYRGFRFGMAFPWRQNRRE